MKLVNTTIYSDEDASDFMCLNGWEFENCVFKDIYFEKKGLQNLENVAYCSTRHVDNSNTCYSGDCTSSATYLPSLAFAQLSNSIFLVPKDQWKDKLIHFVKSNLFVFDFTCSSPIELNYSPSELGTTALFVLKREYDGLPYYLEPRSLLNTLFKNNRIGRYNVSKCLSNNVDVSLTSLNNPVIWDIFEELLDNSTVSILNLPSNNRFQPLKLRKWLIDQIIALKVDIKVPKILAKVTKAQLTKFSEFLYQQDYFDQLYPMSALVLLAIESTDLINKDLLLQQEQIITAYHNEPSSLIEMSSKSIESKNLVSHLLQLAIPGCDYNAQVLLETEQELNRQSTFNKRSEFLVAQWYELLCKYQRISVINEESIQIWKETQSYLSKSYVLPNSVKDFANSFASYITSTQASLPKKFDKVVVVFEQGMSIDEAQSLKEIARKYNLENQLICITDQIL
eukprot:NODE_786_length_4265_cov_0.251320.p2 type:complete len:453 gc:universal NODE_786_length_4265_cov_0.251320:4080-2722(-)